MVQVLFPNSMLNERKVDEYFEPQFNAVKDAGIHAAVYRGSKTQLVEGEPVVYRGWIMTSDEYDTFEKDVTALGGTLLTDLEDYEHGQFLDLWYEYFMELTPASLILDKSAVDDLVPYITDPGPFIIKDSSKSFKHDWDKACYVPTREDLPRVIEGFRELSDGMITRALIIREFEEWEDGQNRLWWVNGELAAESAHPDTPDVLKTFTPEQIAQVQAGVAELGCAFVTTDVVRHTDGSIRVVEVGDGQVSDLPDIAVLTAVLNKMKEL